MALKAKSNRRPENIRLYDGSRSARFHAGDLAAFLEETLPGVSIEVRKDIVSRAPRKTGALAKMFARAKVVDPRKPRVARTPLPGEIQYELNRLHNEASGIFGNIYDGLPLQEAFGDLLPPEERSLRDIHMVITNQQVATWDEDDLRYHVRAAIYGIPNILSTAGLVEGPARPREYYLLKQGMGPFRWDGAARAEMEGRMKDRMLRHDDERLTEVMKGYAMQAVMYHATGDPYCGKVTCRLYNAHWQEEMLEAQMGQGPDFCPRHARDIAGWKAGRT